MDRLGITTVHKCHRRVQAGIVADVGLKWLGTINRSAWVVALIPLFAVIELRQCKSEIKLNVGVAS